MPYRELPLVEDEVQARELGNAIQEVQAEFRRMASMIPADAQGAQYATAIAQEVLDRLCPSRGYRVTCKVPRGSRACELTLEEWLPEL